eukprot:1023081_1
MSSSMTMTSFLISLCIPTISDSTWITSTTTLPRAHDSMTIGCYDNNSIFLLGGSPFGRQLTEYDISQDKYTFDRTFVQLSGTEIYGVSSYYTQIDHLLYILDEFGMELLSYDMQSQSITDHFVSIDVDATHGCLASNADHLFVVGGYDALADLTSNLLQALYLPTKTWLNNTPKMNQKRIQFTCIVDPLSNILYAIGGSDYANNIDTYTNTIEYVDTTNIISNTWSYFPGELNQPFGWMRSVWYNQLIFIIGGAYGQDNAWSFLKEVNIIDTLNDNVYLSPDPLPYAASSISAIVVRNTLYAFGGYDGSYVDGVLTYNMDRLFSSSPSHIPTETPTRIASSAPSNTPSQIPTSHAPTVIPTTAPSGTPSSTPSNEPSGSPIVQSITTTNPSTAPTPLVYVPAPSISEQAMTDFPTYVVNISSMTTEVSATEISRITTHVTQNTRGTTALKESKNQNNWQNQVDLRMFVIFIGITAASCCFVCLVIGLITTRKRTSTQHQDNVKQIVIEDIEPQVMEIPHDMVMELQTVMKGKCIEGSQRVSGSRSNDKRHSTQISEGVVQQFTVEGNILKVVNEDNMMNIQHVGLNTQGNDHCRHVTKGTDDTYNIGNRCDDFVVVTEDDDIVTAQ